MKLPAPLCPRRTPALRVIGLCLLVLTGCGHPKANTRPASSLSEKDRALLDQYEQIRVALADDDLRTTRVAAGTMSLSLKPADEKAAAPGPYASASLIATAPALDRARQLFKILSAKIIPLASGVEGYYVMTYDMPSCGDWVQRSAKADNPYMGKSLREYGELKIGSK